MRVFVAIDLDPSLRRRLSELGRELRPSMRNTRFVAEENLHLTLRFLGEIASDVVDPLVARLAEALRGFSPFTLVLRGSGVFPDTKRPRVLWVGIVKPPPALGELHASVETAVRELGFAPESRPFRPHLTLARFRGPERRLSEILESTRESEWGHSLVREVVLYESRLSSRGASYHVVQTFPLSA